MARLGEVMPESAELDSLVSEKLAEAPPRKAKKTKSAAVVLKIRRVSGISAAGKILVKDTDLYDEVEVDDTDTLLIEVLRSFFRTQGAEEDLSNWEIKALVPGKCIDVNVETTPAMLCSDRTVAEDASLHVWGPGLQLQYLEWLYVSRRRREVPA